MAKVKSLQSSEESKAKKEAEDLRFKFAKTEEQKKFLKDNPNVKTMGEMKKKIADKKSVGASRMGPFMAKGGRVKGCKLAKRGKGKAYGKNS
jgi:hypothetical protein